MIKNDSYDMWLAQAEVESAETGKGYFAILNVDNDLMKSVVWVVVFPWGKSYTFTDVLN